MDLLELPLTEHRNHYLFVATDIFSRFSIPVPLCNKSTETIVRALLNHVICPLTAPEVLLSDSGAVFVYNILDSLCQEFKIKKCTILPFTGQVLMDLQKDTIVRLLTHYVLLSATLTQYGILTCHRSWLP